MFAGKEKAYKEYCENTFSLKFENLMSSNVYSTNQRTNPHVKESSKALNFPNQTHRPST